VAAGARRHQVAIYHHILVDVDRAHVADVAVEVGMAHHGPPPHQLRRGGDQPHAVADDPFEDRGFGKGALHELGGRGQLAQLLAVAQPVGDEGGRHDDGVEAAQVLIAHALEALATVEGGLVLMAGEG
jgi:hypothetical protein